ncbi:unspecified product [Leishmania tarentolae]|uniref:Unspecified product n=1 Tax=Leishmania tarentolae TaxID=5689 RepID=A0A640KDC4_LEITA|nr:unspecified product [Leishmania tarentolae]
MPAPAAPSSATVAEPTSSGGDVGSVETSRIPCRITAHQWDTVAVWSWDVQTRVCAICKNSLADHCINCLAKAPSSINSAASAVAVAGAQPVPSSSHPASTVPATSAGRSTSRTSTSQSSQPPTANAKHPTPARLADLSDKCCVAWGTCGHVYHYHCVSRWLQMRSMCPVCGRQWQLHKITSNE